MKVRAITKLEDYYILWTNSKSIGNSFFIKQTKSDMANFITKDRFSNYKQGLQMLSNVK